MATELTEQEIQVAELETRVDRLRALYDQYFMGIEKLQPSVPQKDVERRVQALRKTQIRNTALRFRFQMIIQKLSTYQSHWQRICRQIEEGTYKRDIRRANERFGEGARRRDRAKEIEVEVDLDDFNVTELDVRELLAGLGDELDAETIPPPLRPGNAAAPVSRRHFDGPSSVTNPGGFSLDDPDDGMPIAPRGPIEERPSRKLLAAEPPRKGGILRKSGPPPPRARLRRLRHRAREQRKRPSPPRSHPDRRASFFPEESRAPNRRQRPPPPRPTQTTLRRARRKSTRRRPKQRPKPSPRRPPLPPSARSARASPPPQPPSAQFRYEQPPRARAEGELSDERVRQLYTQYIEAKRSRQESTASLTYDSMAQSLRDSSVKLRQKHDGKNVDFEVTVKDGKTILRPVVK